MKRQQLVVTLAALIVGLVNAQAQVPSTNDLWDVTQGTIVTGHSPLDAADGSAQPYDASNIFGGTIGTYSEGAAGRTVFIDGQTAGFVHYVEWRTQAPVVVRSLRLFAAGDGSGAREFATFRLYAKTNTSGEFSLVAEHTPRHPYAYITSESLLLFASNIRPVTAQEFRAEFLTDGSQPATFSGPRIIELDAFATFLGPATSVRVSQVEVCWDASPGVLYQLEYRTVLPGDTWTPIGQPVAGTGERMCLNDLVAVGGERRFYQVRRLE